MAGSMSKDIWPAIDWAVSASIEGIASKTLGQRLGVDRTAASGRSRRALSRAARRGLAASVRRRATLDGRKSRRNRRRPGACRRRRLVEGDRPAPVRGLRRSGSAGPTRSVPAEAAARPGNRCLLSSLRRRNSRWPGRLPKPGSSRQTARLPSGWAVRTMSVPAVIILDSRRRLA